MNQEIESLVIFSGEAWEAEIVKSILENEGIEAFLKDEYIGMLAPWYAAGGGAGAVKVVVSNLDEKKAAAIVAEFEKNRNNETT